MAQFKIKLNSPEKTEALLQEIYEDVNRQMNLIQNKITELTESTTLVDAPLDAKAKYAKAIHDYLTDRDKSIGRKLDVSKLMVEVLKYNGNVEKMMSESDIAGSLDDMFKNIRDGGDEPSKNETQETEIYKTNSSKQ